MTSKKTLITSANQNAIEQGFKNPFGMLILDQEDVRTAVANHAKSIIEKLHANKKSN